MYSTENIIIETISKTSKNLLYRKEILWTVARATAITLRDISVIINQSKINPEVSPFFAFSKNS